MSTSMSPLMIFLPFVIVVIFHVEAGVACQSTPPSPSSPSPPIPPVPVPPPGNKIYGGQPVNISTVPWQVALLLTTTYEFKCGGIIISDQWILSAAHCVSFNKPSTLTARVGSNAFASGGQTYKVSKGLSYKGYDEHVHNDICVLMTATRMDLGDSVVPKAIRLPAQGAPAPEPGTMLFTSGWGRTSNINVNDSPTLMGVQIEMVEFSECQSHKELEKYNPDESQQLCAGKNGLDSCTGDSGGPLVNGCELVGIVSYGPKICGESVAIYTKVSNYRDWIRENTGV